MNQPLSRLVGYACAALGAALFSTKAIFIVSIVSVWSMAMEL